MTLSQGECTFQLLFSYFDYFGEGGPVTGEADHKVSNVLAQQPQTSFEAKKWLEVNVPRGGSQKIFPEAIKDPFPQALHFLGKQSIPREKESYFTRDNFPQRENLPSEENPPNF